MAGIQNFLDLIRPDYNLCPDPTLRWAAIRAARRFCTESRAYRETCFVDLAAGYDTYELTPNAITFTDQEATDQGNLEVLGVIAIEVNDKPYQPASAEAEPDTCGQYVFYPLHTIRIWPIPSVDTTTGMKVRAVLQPTLLATAMPTSITARFGEQISYGVAEILLSQKDRPWTDVAEGRKAGAKFTDAIATCRGREDWSNRTREKRTRMHT